MQIFLLLLFLAFSPLYADQWTAALLPSTESDPDAFIGHYFNAITGDYCETVTDLVINGPDPLILQRHYNSKNYMTGEKGGGWRLFSQNFLILGKEPSRTSPSSQERIYAFTGARSGAILTYTGYQKGDIKTEKKSFKDCLKVCMGHGMSNTYAKEISGQTNHQNNQLFYSEQSCALILGDGTKRLYQPVKDLPCLLFGEEIHPLLINKLAQPQYFRLVSEILPSGNVVNFTYDSHGHLSLIEMQNGSCKKTLSWIRFCYDFLSTGCLITVTSSDHKTLLYTFERQNNGLKSRFVLKEVSGSHTIPCTYKYAADYQLIKKNLPEGRFLEIEYNKNGLVKAFKEPSALSGNPETTYEFSYGDGFTDAFDASGKKRRYVYDTRRRLIAVELYDNKSHLYRMDRKCWSDIEGQAGCLLTRITADGTGCICSYCSLSYDDRGNVVEEKLYGNLSGSSKAPLQLDESGKLIHTDALESYSKKLTYSQDGFNLLISLSHSDNQRTLYHYQKGSNRLIKKFIQHNGKNARRHFYTYHDDGFLVKSVEDDSSLDDERELSFATTERHIIETSPREILPNGESIEVVKEKAWDCKAKREIPVKKLVNTYAPQGQLLSSETYDADGNYASTFTKTYNCLGLVTSEIAVNGKQQIYSYDAVGNLTSTFIPDLNKETLYHYDYRNQPIQIIESAENRQFMTQHVYDILERKTATTDPLGNTTTFEYDDFGHLTKIIHPCVYDENEKVIQPSFSYSYDIFGRVLSITDPKNMTTYKSYQLQGKPCRILYPDGTMELFHYNLDGSLRRSMGRDQIITAYTYDNFGRVTTKQTLKLKDNQEFKDLYRTDYTYSGYRLKKECKEYSKSTYFTYDPIGRVTAVIQPNAYKDMDDPYSRKTEYAYDALGRVSHKKVWFDVGTNDYSLECFEYDQAGQVITQKSMDHQGYSVFHKSFSYDLSGHCLEESSFRGDVPTTSKTTYNVWGDLISSEDPLGKETQIVIDYSHHNLLGQNTLKKTILNPLGTKTDIEFDALARVVAISKYDSQGTLLSDQRCRYDALGNKACEVNLVISNGQILGEQVTRWHYGPMGRVDEQIEAFGTPEEKRTTYTYNSAGRLIAKNIPGFSGPLTYDYDDYGRISKIEYQDEERARSVLNEYSYDRHGTVTKGTSLDPIRSCNTVIRDCDVYGNAYRETTHDAIDGYHKVECQYDRIGRIKSINLPDESSIQYQYDAFFGRKVSRLSPKGDVLYTHDYDTYDDQGYLLEETLPGSAGYRESAYDPCGRKSLSKTDVFTEIVPKGGYSDLGHILALEKKADFAVENASYTYNALSQLTSEKTKDVKTYAYDSLDNRLQDNDSDLIYNALNQLTESSSAEYKYDAQGNLLRKILDGQEAQFETNILGQIASIKKVNREPALFFSYDAFGRRRAKRTVDCTGDYRKILSKILSNERYFFVHDLEIGTVDRRSQIQSLRVPGLKGNQLSLKSVAIEIGKKWYTPLHDLSGNIVALVDLSNQSIAEHYTFSAFGQETIYDSLGQIIHQSAVGNPWRFSEKRVDEETGLVFFGRRYYDPAIGRWITPDPLGFIDGQNLYAYVHNHPVNSFDRLGFSTEDESSGSENEQWLGQDEATGSRTPYNWVGIEITSGKSRYLWLDDLQKAGGSSLSEASPDQAGALPKISYDDTFEDAYPDFERSHLYDLGLPEVANIGIGFINGMANSKTQAAANANYISKLSGGYNVHAVYNATHDTKVDFKECRMGLNYIATEPVRQLHKMWNSYFERSSADARFLMICHSQGAIHVRNALLDYPENLRNRILVVAIAPGGYIYQRSCAHVIHYRAPGYRDFVPLLDGAGRRRSKNTTIILDSHEDADLHDHAFQSPTYREKLQEHIDGYFQSQGKML